MTITVLVCNADGTQILETREVPADWLPTAKVPAPLTGDEIPVE